QRQRRVTKGTEPEGGSRRQAGGRDADCETKDDCPASPSVSFSMSRRALRGPGASRAERTLTTAQRKNERRP
ncbi:MAG: hypothetical protein PHH39_09850, partial [Methanothrix soehngenii]|nr:hypothetical protein [Methanothrix soehngenii]